MCISSDNHLLTFNIPQVIVPEQVHNDEESDTDRDFDTIILSITTLPLPPHIFDDSLPEDMDAENACVDHVKQQLLQLSPGEYYMIIDTYRFIEYAARSIAGLEGP